MFYANHDGGSKYKKRSNALLGVSFLLAVLVAACGSTGGSSSGTTTVPVEDLKAELATGLKNVYTKLQNADYKTSKLGDGILDSEDVSAALLKQNLYSKVDVGMDDQGFFISRNLCGGQGYDSILKALRPSETVFSTAFKPQNLQDNKSREYVVMFVQLSVFPDVIDAELIDLYRNFSDTVSSVGSTCTSTFRNGLTKRCDFSKIKSSIPNWWVEDDIKEIGCEIGNGKTEVTSAISQVDIDFFNFPFLLNQVSSKDRGRLVARSVVVLPQRTLKTVFVLEVTAIRNGLVTSSSDVPSLRDVALNATNVAASLTNKWAETIRQEFDLTSLMAKDSAIFTQENEG